MTARFSGKTALVTGAGSGLGRAVALAFAAQGANVVVAGRGRATLDETVAQAARQAGAGGTVVAVTADVSRSEDVRALVRESVERFGSLDVAVNNAGVFRGGGPVAELSEEDWRTLLDVNVTGVLLSMQAEIDAMRSQEGGGAIVNVSSNLGAHLRVPGVAGYVASKAAVSALTRAAAVDHIQDGVRINAVSPGPAATAMSLLPGESDAERAVRMKGESPLGRVSTTAEVAAAVLYLASADAASVVGTDLVVDGGASA
ncbi:SDR family NAD(P)-dependent oxidoreductase [Streptomyces albidochromogenes]|uniref:SDR family NAD(P)-dependent oxidoreductase n=1 Tax=Streptomyces albidochromogenes TaxID=329524 RepID=A0ABW6FJ52_9ACTN